MQKSRATSCHITVAPLYLRIKGTGIEDLYVVLQLSWKSVRHAEMQHIRLVGIYVHTYQIECSSLSLKF